MVRHDTYFFFIYTHPRKPPKEGLKYERNSQQKQQEGLYGGLSGESR
jgi:hypothetical protein